MHHIQESTEQHSTERKHKKAEPVSTDNENQQQPSTKYYVYSVHKGDNT